MSHPTPAALEGFCAGKRLRQRFKVSGVGPPLVLVHGVGTRLEDMDLLCRELEPYLRVLRYDLRGHGESEKVPGPYTLEDFSDDLVELLDAMQWERVHCFGFSLGGLIVQRFALDHPDRLVRAGLISAIAGRTPEERASALRRADELRDGGGATSHLDQAVTRWFTDAFRAANPDVIEGRKQRILANHPQCYAAAYRVLASYDLADELPKIRHETLVATGEFDQGSNTRMSRLMAQRIPHAQLRILPGMKHALLLECPHLLADLIKSFVLTGRASTEGYISE
ncbi:MAG TPA: alpha/beta fold hydrolase [Burkholderiales bacterium]|nr:alpha/beta fold hydrolase [Burkholderiales bacterium]